MKNEFQSRCSEIIKKNERRRKILLTKQNHKTFKYIYEIDIYVFCSLTNRSTDRKVAHRNLHKKELDIYIK